MTHGALEQKRSWWHALGICLSLGVALFLVSCGGGGKKNTTTGPTEPTTAVQSAQAGPHEEPGEEPNHEDPNHHPNCTTGTATATATIEGDVINSTVFLIPIAINANICFNEGGIITIILPDGVQPA